MRGDLNEFMFEGNGMVKIFRVDENRVYLIFFCNWLCEVEFISCVRRRLRIVIFEIELNFEVLIVFKKEVLSSCCFYWFIYIENI